LQELKGSALLEFMMKKQGITWDSTTIDNVTLQDLDSESFKEFRKKATKSGRLSADDLKVTDDELLDLLGLKEKGKLSKAAVLLFHKNPEKIIFGSYVKIGFFANDSDLRYQDEVYGSLVMLPDKIIDLLYLKYFKGWITYEGLIRVENYPAPKDAMREAVLNALIHRDYTTGIPIQIKVLTIKLSFLMMENYLTSCL
jgi:ATP-dependent DNA helicase RecG